jgi:NMD protein affecting ribosome stability and mRNA decay
VTSWRQDERFKCPLCGSLVQIKFVDRPQAIPSVKEDGTVAVCFTCERIFSPDQWRDARLDPEEARREHAEWNRRLRMEREQRIRNAKERQRLRNDKDKPPDGYDVPF